MMGQQIFILLIAIVCITLAHGATKVKKNNTKPKKLYRQGLEVSLETHEANSPLEPLHEPLHESAAEYPTENGGDQKVGSVNNDNNFQDQNQEYDGSNLAHIDKMEQEFEDDDEDGLLLDLESGEFDSDEMIMLQGKGTRGIEAGDIFTATDMLPIAVKLMNRAKSNGKGKGIVTSETNPKSLADNLFEKYFWKNCEIHLLNGETVVSQADDWCNLVETTDEKKVFKMKRIVLLKDEDISGLDALQALALSGTVSTRRSIEKYIAPETDLKKRDKALPDSTEIAPRRKSRYRLLTKPFYDKIRRVPRRRENYHTRDGRKARTVKKRKLVVNPKRRRLVKKIKNSKGREGQPQAKKLKKIGRQGEKLSEKRGKTPNKKDGASKTKRFCRWKYGCKHHLVLESCRLSMDCSEDAKSKDYLGIELLPHEKRENLAMLRNWAGVDVMDTEVEKILENRYHQQLYSKLGNIPRSESIADYFNNLIHFQKHEYEHNGEGPTTPMYSNDDIGDRDAQDDASEQSNGPSGEDAAQDTTQDAKQVTQDDPGTESNGLSGEEPELQVVQLNAEVMEPAEGQDDVEEAAEPGIVKQAAEPGVVAEAEMQAEDGIIQPEPMQEEAAGTEIAPELATELADTENRRKFLSDHKTTSEKYKRI